MLRAPTRLESDEIENVLQSDVPARLATLDRDGFPHVTPLRFVWVDGAFFMTSLVDRPDVSRLRRDPRAGVCVDVEDPERLDGQRPNRQVRAIGTAELTPGSRRDLDHPDHKEVRSRPNGDAADRVTRG